MSGPTKSGNDDDDKHVNKENATPPMLPPSTEVRLRVGGATFVLDQDTLQKLNSEYLDTGIAMAMDPDISTTSSSSSSPSSSIQDHQYQEATPNKHQVLVQENEASATVVIDEADAESFSSLVHMARFGSLPTSIFDCAKRELLLNEAEHIWGIRPLVEVALEKARDDFRQSCDCPGAVYRCLMMTPMSTTPPAQQPVDANANYRCTPATLAQAAPAANAGFAAANASKFNSYAAVPAGESAVSLGGPHHNFRRDDGSRRVFCSSCGHRDIDWRYHVGDYYSSCQKCQKEIRYKPDLGWCHKCRQCDECQTAECPGVPIRQLEEQVVPFMIATLKSNENSLSFF